MKGDSEEVVQTLPVDWFIDPFWPLLAVHVTMNKLLQWVSVLLVFLATWLALLFDKLPFKISTGTREVVWAFPIYLLMAFACYSLAVIGYGVATFNDCKKAANELKVEIEDAKEDLLRKGLKLS
ncbi:Dolichol-phosphate mannosyltransferase subunit 3 [Lamellibrachia satsuma]|nr:Dolichol-phosphate mannosyltransferase subunit 3 [Lamellibrachia satsuma]